MSAISTASTDQPLRLSPPWALAAGNRLGAAALVQAAILGVPGPHLADQAAMGRHLSRIDPALAAAYAAPAPTLTARGDDGHAAIGRLAVALLRLLTPMPVRCIVESDRRPALLSLEIVVFQVAADAMMLATAIAAGEPGDEARLRQSIVDFRSAGERLLPDAGEAILLARIDARGLPWHRVDDGPARSYVVIGEGRHRRRLRQTISEQTAHMAGTLAERKDQCTRLLAHHLLPVPRQHLVQDAEGAVQAAAAIGYPVVVKPVDSSGGKGVSVGLDTPAAVRDACMAALAHSRRAVVESQLFGQDYRMLVIGGRLAAVTRRVAAQVTGDGRHSIAELVAAANADPRRIPPAGLLRPLPLDAEALQLLAADGWTPTAVPAAGQHVRLRTASNRAQGGTTEDVTAQVHPDNAELACQVTALLGLDVAGLDVITPDIAMPIADTGGGICEVNRNPALLTHLSAPGAPDVASAYLDHVMEGAGRVRIPIVAILGGAAADAVAADTAGRLEGQGIATGLAWGDRTISAGLPLAATPPGDPRRVARLVADPGVDAVVVAVPAAALLASGFGHRRCDLAVAIGTAAEAPAHRAALRLLAGLGAETASFDPADGDAAAAWLAARVARR